VAVRKHLTLPFLLVTLCDLLNHVFNAMILKFKKKTPPEKAGLNDRWTVLGVCIFLAAIVWVVFGQTLRYGFVNFDDSDYVYRNPVVQKGLTLKGIVWAFTHVYAFN
jgi:hypothetical protein